MSFDLMQGNDICFNAVLVQMARHTAQTVDLTHLPPKALLLVV